MMVNVTRFPKSIYLFATVVFLTASMIFVRFFLWDLYFATGHLTFDLLTSIVRNFLIAIVFCSISCFSFRKTRNLQTSIGSLVLTLIVSTATAILSVKLVEISGVWLPLMVGWR